MEIINNEHTAIEDIAPGKVVTLGKDTFVITDSYNASNAEIGAINLDTGATYHFSPTTLVKQVTARLEINPGE